jgi:peptide deformylase
MSEVITFHTESAVKDAQRVSTPDIKPYILVGEDNPILKEYMPDFDFGAPEIEPIELASRLVETCKLNSGYGLSANQCGIRARVFVMGAGEEYVAFFNPKIVAVAGESHMDEGCLSFPLLGLKITRPAEVMVEYQDYNGTPRKATYVGISARCFQHELDHMNGIVYTQRCKPLALSMAIKKRDKTAKNLFKINNGNITTKRR